MVIWFVDVCVLATWLFWYTVLLSSSLAGRASPLPRAELHDPVSLVCSTTGRIPHAYGSSMALEGSLGAAVAVVMVLRLLCFGTCFSFASG